MTEARVLVVHALLFSCTFTRSHQDGMSTEPHLSIYLVLRILCLLEMQASYVLDKLENSYVLSTCSLGCFEDKASLNIFEFEYFSCVLVWDDGAPCSVQWQAG